MRRPKQIQTSERGVALMVALLVLVALSAIALTMMKTIMSERRLTGYDLLAAKALNNAEAGVAEALERIRNFDVPSTEDPKMVAQIFLAKPGDVPVKGADTTALATAQPEGEWINYTTPKSGPDALTISYKTTPDKSKIYRYSKLNVPAVGTVVGSPIYVVTATGTAGNAKRRIVTEVVNPLFKPNLKAAVATTKDNLDLKEDTYVFGTDYKATTPTGTGSDKNPHPSWETGTAAVAGAYSRKKVDLSSGADSKGSPDKLENQPIPYSGPWDVLNMSQSAFLAWIGAPNGDKKQGNPRGLTFLDKDPKKTNEKFQLKGGFNGDGLLYVHGKLEINGDFTFRGLIYCTDEIKIHGNAWILGAVVAKKMHIHQKGSGTIVILRSDEAVRNNISKAGSTFITLGWREVDSNDLGVPAAVASE